MLVDSDQVKMTHRLFLVILYAKAALGVIQIAIAAALVLGVFQQLPTFAQWLVSEEIADDPQDFIATHILALVQKMPVVDLTFYEIYFAAHGLLHLGIVAALLYRAHWANHVAIAILVVFVIYQLFEWTKVGGALLIVLSVIDIFVIYLTFLDHKNRPA